MVQGMSDRAALSAQDATQTIAAGRTALSMQSRAPAPASEVIEAPSPRTSPTRQGGERPTLEEGVGTPMPNSAEATSDGATSPTPDRTTPTMEDVARTAGVSRQTVSNVVNAPAKVQPKTRARVEAAIKQLNYRPHPGARRLRTNKSRTIGICLEPYAGGISGVILDRFLHALTAGAATRGYRILVYAADSIEDEIRQATTLAAEHEIDSVVITSTFAGDPRGKALREAGVHYVSFGRPWGEEDLTASDWVDVDCAVGTGLATVHAFATTGKNVAFLGWPGETGIGGERRRGWNEAMRAKGSDPTPLLIYANDHAPDAQEAVVNALESGQLEGVGSIVCASDLLAVGAALALLDANRPEITVTGFDNTPTSDALSFSSVEQHPEQVAEAVLELLIDGTSEPRQVLINPTLVVRESATTKKTGN